MLLWLKSWFIDLQIARRLDSMDNKLSQIDTEMQLFKADMLDSVLPQVEKLSKRMATRLKREEPPIEPPVTNNDSGLGRPPVGTKWYGGKSKALLEGLY